MDLLNDAAGTGAATSIATRCKSRLSWVSIGCVKFDKKMLALKLPQVCLPPEGRKNTNVKTQFNFIFFYRRCWGMSTNAGPHKRLNSRQMEYTVQFAQRASKSTPKFAIHHLSVILPSCDAAEGSQSCGAEEASSAVSAVVGDDKLSPTHFTVAYMQLGVSFAPSHLAADTVLACSIISPKTPSRPHPPDVCPGWL